MSCKIRHEAGVIIGEKARFQPLTNNLIRMEYSEKGSFEDRPSIRAINRPEPREFESINKNDREVVMKIKNIKLEYRADGRSFNENNLAARWSDSGEKFWFPGKVDHENLGGFPHSLDLIQHGMIPEGVHPAKGECKEKSTKYNLWNVVRHIKREDYDPKRVGDEVLFELSRALEKIWDDLPEEIQSIVEQKLKYPPGILSKNGYYLLNDSKSAMVDPETGWLADRKDNDMLDYYLFAYGKDYPKALQDFVNVFGKIPMLPRYILGSWYSRYPTFNEKGLRKLVKNFSRRNIPLDVLVLDLEWHLRGWHGWDWDEKHIPNPEEFIDWLHERNIRVTCNVHPQGVPYHDRKFKSFLDEAEIDLNENIEDKGETENFQNFNLAVKDHAESFMDILHHPIQEDGIDFWWIDGHKADFEGVDPQLWTNHVYMEHARKTFGKDKRPFILSRCGGVGSHRYPVHFTGDTISDWETLDMEVEHLLRAGNLGCAYVSNDMGGHISKFKMMDPELLLRWIQFGVLSPVLRLHSAGGGERRPWAYPSDPRMDEEMEVASGFEEGIEKAYRFRMRILPLLYNLVHKAYKTGMPICRPLYLNHPNSEEAYKHMNEYYIGERILAAPITFPKNWREVYLPEGKWYYVNDEIVYNGNQEIEIEASPSDKPPVFYRMGSVIVKQPFKHQASEIPSELSIEVFTGSDDTYKLYEDDGFSRRYKEGAFAETKFRYSEEGKEHTLTIKPTQGDFANLPSKREYKVKMMMMDEPEHVRLDGNEHEFDYEEEDKKVLIPIREKYLDEPTKIKVL